MQNAFPDWYWSRGLHDAMIVGTAEIALDYDYTERDPDRNCFVLRLDAEQAMFDTSVKEIRLYNYKILSPDVKLDAHSGAWWIWDRLCRENRKYVLEIRVGEPSRQFSFVIRFDRAEVVR